MDALSSSSSSSRRHKRLDNVHPVADARRRNFSRSSNHQLFFFVTVAVLQCSVAFCSGNTNNISNQQFVADLIAKNALMLSSSSSSSLSSNAINVIAAPHSLYNYSVNARLGVVEHPMLRLFGACNSARSDRAASSQCSAAPHTECRPNPSYSTANVAKRQQAANSRLSGRMGDLDFLFRNALNTGRMGRSLPPFLSPDNFFDSNSDTNTNNNRMRGRSGYGGDDGGDDSFNGYSPNIPQFMPTPPISGLSFAPTGGYGGYGGSGADLFPRTPLPGLNAAIYSGVNRRLSRTGRSGDYGGGGDPCAGYYASGSNSYGSSSGYGGGNDYGYGVKKIIKHVYNIHRHHIHNHITNKHERFIYRKNHPHQETEYITYVHNKYQPIKYKHYTHTESTKVYDRPEKPTTSVDYKTVKEPVIIEKPQYYYVDKGDNTGKYEGAGSTQQEARAVDNTNIDTAAANIANSASASTTSETKREKRETEATGDNKSLDMRSLCAGQEGQLVNGLRSSLENYDSSADSSKNPYFSPSASKSGYGSLARRYGGDGGGYGGGGGGYGNSGGGSYGYGNDYYQKPQVIVKVHDVYVPKYYNHYYDQYETKEFPVENIPTQSVTEKTIVLEPEYLPVKVVDDYDKDNGGPGERSGSASSSSASSSTVAAPESNKLGTRQARILTFADDDVADAFLSTPPLEQSEYACMCKEGFVPAGKAFGCECPAGKKLDVATDKCVPM